MNSQNVVSEQPERFFVAELIREKVFLLYAQEIPYSVQVRGGGRERGGNKGGKGARRCSSFSMRNISRTQCR